MKIFNAKGYLIKRCSLMIVISLMWLGCENEPAVPSNGTEVSLRVAEPYLQVVTGYLPMEVGASYTLKFNAINGTEAISGVKLFGTFTDGVSGLSSNEVLYGEYNIDSPTRKVITDEFTYDELKIGLLVNGNPLPASDIELSDGSGWSFRFEGVKESTGEAYPLNGEINMLFSKYAGIYKVSNSVYMRIQQDFVLFPPDGVETWDDEEVFIGYVDSNTLSYNDRWGYFETPSCSWNFDYDEHGVVTAPILTTVVCASVAALPASCAANGSGFNNLSTYLGYDVCVESNVIIDNLVTGEHVIKLTYGYVGAGGVRQFTETLTKVVN